MIETIKVVLPIVISCIGTYFATKWSTTRKYVREVSQVQLTKIFKPLILYDLYQSNSLDEMNTHGFYKLLHQIIIDYYEHIPKEMIELEKCLSEAIKEEDDSKYMNIHIELKSYVNNRFDILKRKLNLPSENLANRWKLMSKQEKINWIKNELGIPLFIYFIFFLTLILTLDILEKKNIIHFIFTNPTAFLLISFSSLIITVSFYNTNK